MPPPSATACIGTMGWQEKMGGRRGEEKGACIKLKDMLDVFSSAMRRQIGEQVGSLGIEARRG